MRTLIPCHHTCISGKNILFFGLSTIILMIKTPQRLLFLQACFLFIVFFSCSKPGDGPEPNKAPASFELSIAELKPTSVKLTWTAATDPEGSPVTYAVMLGTDTVNKTSARQFEFTTLQEDKDY